MQPLHTHASIARSLSLSRLGGGLVSSSSSGGWRRGIQHLMNEGVVGVDAHVGGNLHRLLSCGRKKDRQRGAAKEQRQLCTCIYYITPYNTIPNSPFRLPMASASMPSTSTKARAAATAKLPPDPIAACMQDQRIQHGKYHHARANNVSFDRYIKQLSCSLYTPTPHTQHTRTPLLHTLLSRPRSSVQCSYSTMA